MRVAAAALVLSSADGHRWLYQPGYTPLDSLLCRGQATDAAPTSFLSQTAPTLMSDRIRTPSWLSKRYWDLIDGLEGEGTAHLGSGGAGPRGQERGLDDLVDPGPVHEVVADECLFVPARLEHHHGRATRAEGSDLATK